MPFTIDTVAEKPRVVDNGQHRLVRHLNGYGDRPHTTIVFSDSEWEAIRAAVHLEDLNGDRGLRACDHGSTGNTIPSDCWVRDAKNIQRCVTCGVALW